MKITYKHPTANADVGFYLLPLSRVWDGESRDENGLETITRQAITDAMATAEPAGRHVYGTEETPSPVQVGSVELYAEEDYLLVLQGEGDVKGPAHITALTFDGLNPNALSATAIDLERWVIGEGESTQAQVLAQNAQLEPADLAGVAITYESGDAAVAAVDHQGRITAVGPGKTSIRASFTYGGEPYTVSRMLWVLTDEGLDYSGAHVDVNFMMRSTTWSPVASDDVNDVRGITYADTDGNWQFYSFNPGFIPNGKVSFYQWRGTALRTQMAKAGEWTAIAVKFPNPGRYRASLSSQWGRKNYGITDFYLIPMADADAVQALLTPGAQIGRGVLGTPDAPAADEETTLDFGEIVIPEAGEYLFVLQQEAVTPGTYTFLKRMTLNGLFPLESVVVEADKEELAIGERAKVALVSGKLSNGADADISGALVAYESSAPDIAEVSESGIVTGRAPGQAEISVQVTIDGVTKGGKVSVTVRDGEATPVPLSGEAQTYDLISKSGSWVNAESGNPLDIRGITYDYTDGFWMLDRWDPAMVPNYATFYMYSSYLRTGVGVGQWFALRLKVPAAGPLRDQHTAFCRQYGRASECVFPACIHPGYRQRNCGRLLSNRAAQLHG